MNRCRVRIQFSLTVMVSMALVYACSCQTTAPSDGNPQVVAADLPGWVQMGDGPFLCANQEVLRAVAHKKLDRVSLAKLGAQKAAKERLAVVAEAWVSFLLKEYYRRREQKGEKAPAVWSPLARDVTKRAMSEVKIIETFRSTDGQTFALAELSVEDAKRAWRDLNLDSGEKPFLIENASIAFKHSEQKLREVCTEP